MNCDVIVGVNESKFIVLAFEKPQFLTAQYSWFKVLVNHGFGK